LRVLSVSYSFRVSLVESLDDFLLEGIDGKVPGLEDILVRFAEVFDSADGG
jgi:hypothetical protein